MSSEKPVVKPKRVTKKTASVENKKETPPDRDDQTSPGTDTSQDEEFARQLQEEMMREQQELDAQMARRLQEEEQRKQPAPVRIGALGGRPMSATPLQNLFQTLFGLTARTMELEDEDDDDDDATPAMEPGEAGSRPSQRALGLQRPMGRGLPARPAVGRSPDRARRGLNRSPERGGAGRAIERRPSEDDPTDLLPGVRANPARVRLRPRPRRVIVGANAPQEGTGEEAEGASNVRPISAIRRPGLGPREETMQLPDGELDPDFMVLDTSSNEGAREDNFVNIMRDPFFLMLLLMGRHPGIMIPDDVDAGDYEALWEMAERLGEVRDRGMKADEISRLPTRTYRQRPGARPEQCAICLNDYHSGEKVQLLPCKHEFHASCLPEWLKRNASCPVCRQNVKRSSSQESK